MNCYLHVTHDKKHQSMALMYMYKALGIYEGACNYSLTSRRQRLVLVLV